MDNYFRITGYMPEKNVSFIMDAYGAYEKLWQFSAAIKQKGCNIIEVGTPDKFLDGNIEKLEKPAAKMVLRATAEGEPVRTSYEYNGIKYNALQVDNKIYIPDKSSI